VQVRGKKYLWGSAGISHNISLSRPLLLHVRNDLFGEQISLGTQVAGGADTVLGTLDPGECVSIPMQDISGVFASCDLESTVACMIKYTD
jgi:hypothetical protein